MTHSDVYQQLKRKATPERAANSEWFFKTEKGQYGYGDQFLGVTVPEQRKIARIYRTMPLAEVVKLLASPWHECRLTALIIMTEQFKRSGMVEREQIYSAYMAHRKQVNNWDLVDTSAHKIVGAWLLDKPRDPLYVLAESKVLWDRRIAIIATFAFINRGDPSDAIALCEKLLQDSEDLMHKAVGWTLREVGKRCDRSLLETFLHEHTATMPRTTLRYAIEHFDTETRQKYLKGTTSS